MKTLGQGLMIKQKPAQLDSRHSCVIYMDGLER